MLASMHIYIYISCISMYVIYIYIYICTHVRNICYLCAVPQGTRSSRASTLPCLHSVEYCYYGLLYYCTLYCRKNRGLSLEGKRRRFSFAKALVLQFAVQHSCWVSRVPSAYSCPRQPQVPPILRIICTASNADVLIRGIPLKNDMRLFCSSSYTNSIEQRN